MNVSNKYELVDKKSRFFHDVNLKFYIFFITCSFRTNNNVITYNLFCSCIFLSKNKVVI